MSIITKHFHWFGIDEKGQCCQDRQFAKNKSILKKQLMQRNITPLTIKSQILINFKARNPPGVSKKYIVEFIKQLSILLSANINLIDAIKILKNEQQSPQLQSTLNDIQQKIEAGHSLSHAMQPLSHLCDNHIINIINVAEKMGGLPTLLKQLSEQLQQQYKIKKKMVAAMYYPASILIVAILVSIGLFVFIIPQFQNIYSSFGATLPAFTQLMIKFSSCVRDYSAYFILTALIIGSTMMLSYKNNKHFKHYLHKILLRLPIIKNSSLDQNIGQWSQILSHSYAAGLPLTEAVTLANQTLSNKYIQQFFNTIPTQLEAGASLSQVVKQQPFFNLRQQHLLTLGDHAGELQQVLQHMSQQCFENLQNTLENLSKLLEPVIIVGIALVCGSCIIAMYLPIFNIGAIV